jgi:large subunit ribosomal protein L25
MTGRPRHRERYAKPAASAGLLGLREQSVQAAGSNLSGSSHNANFCKDTVNGAEMDLERPGWRRQRGGRGTCSPTSACGRVLGYTSNAHRMFSGGESTVPEVHIAAEPRNEFGKGAARRSRREGLVPAVLYGHGTATRHLNLPGHDLMLALKTPNVLLYLDGLKNGSEIALPKAVQRDPVKGFIEHVDLVLVRSGEQVTVEVPVRVTGEIAPGDGLLDQQLVQIPVEAEATNIPQAIEIDVEGMDVGAAVHAGDLKLPRGVTLQVEPDTLVLHVIAQQGAEAPEEEAAAASEIPQPVAETSEGGQERAG